MQDELAELDQQLHELDEQDKFPFNMNSGATIKMRHVKCFWKSWGIN
jgi:hypothetical protein